MERNIEFDTEVQEVQGAVFNEKSEDIAELVKALVQFQSVTKAIPFDQKNPLYNSSYASLAATVEACRKPLADNNLAVTQLVYGEGSVKTVLMHISGQYISCSLFLKPGSMDKEKRFIPRDDPQGKGSAISYTRRYQYSAILGLVSDEDDDGNQASTKTTNGTSSGSKPKGDELVARLKTLVSQAFKDDADMKSADKFTAWRIDNNYPEKMSDATPLDYSRMILKLQEKLNAKA